MMDETEVYTPRVLKAHRAGDMFIHHLDKAWIGYSTGIDAGEPGVVDGAGSLGECLSKVVGTVRRLGDEWSHRVTVHGLERGASQWLTDEYGGDGEAVGRFASELNGLGSEVTLSLNDYDQSSSFARLLVKELEKGFNRGRM